MKNNILGSFIFILFFTLFFINKVNSKNLQINASEIQSLNKGDKIIAKNGVEIIDPKGIVITANEAEYDKINSKIKVKYNVEIEDTINKNTLITNEAIYFVDENKIISKDETVIKIKKYFIDSSNITYDRNSKEIFSNEKTIVRDNYQNNFSSNNFTISIINKILEAKNVRLIDYDLNEYNLNEARLNLKTDEIIGKDLNINFNKKYFSKDNDPRLKANAVIIDKENSKFKKGIFTTCKIREEKCPPWKIAAEEVNHDKKNKVIKYRNAWLQLYDKPILYFPKFFHPDPTVKRQSGFLIPELSSSNNLGNHLSVPYFKVISDNKDLTFTPRFYDQKKIIYQTEYRQVNKNSDHTVDFSIFNKSRLLPQSGKTEATHFFTESNFDTDINFFDNSKIEMKIQQVSEDLYLKTHKLKSALITSETVLNSKIMFEGSNKNLDLNISTEVFEDLSKSDTDRYEYVFPSYNFTRYLESALEGELSFTSIGNSKLYDTNVYEKTMTNNLNYNSLKKISSKGLVTNYEFLLKNFNSDNENSKTSKNEFYQNLQSIVKYQIQYPLKKEGIKFDSVLTPILSARFSPNKSKDIKGDDRNIDYNNIFSLNRIASNETVEGGQSITLGNEYKALDKNGNEVFSLNLATMFRDEENPDLPTKSTLNRKTSNIVGEILFKPKKFFDLKYNFSLDNDMQTLNYNLIDATFSVNNFVTSFEFLEKNNIIGDESYLSNKTTLGLSENSSLSFNTRRNKQLGLNEYYDLIYEYKNDCLKAAVEYKKTYYEDGDLKPEEQIYFSLTVIPFGTANTPNLNK